MPGARIPPLGKGVYRRCWWPHILPPTSFPAADCAVKLSPFLRELYQRDPDSEILTPYCLWHVPELFHAVCLLVVLITPNNLFTRVHLGVPLEAWT